MSVYELLCLSKESDQFEDFFSLHIMSNGMKISFERYCYLLALEKKHPSETHFHLVQDTSIHFDVSEQTIYNDITKMKFEVKGLWGLSTRRTLSTLQFSITYLAIATCPLCRGLNDPK